MKKRTCKSLRLARKVEILEEAKAAKPSKTAIASKFSIAKSMLSGIVKDGKRILDAYNDGDFAAKRKKCAQPHTKTWKQFSSRGFGEHGVITCL